MPSAGRRWPGGGYGAPAWALLWTTFLAALRREHRRAPFALLHGFWATELGYLTALAGRMLGIPALVHLAGGELVHDPPTGYGNQAPGLARLLVASSLRLATGITVPSASQRALLHHRYPAQAGKAIDWALGVDTAMFAPAPVPALAPAANGPLRLVHAASLLPVKHQALLLDGLAAARILAPHRPVALTVAGQGPLEGRCARRRPGWVSPQIVTFAGNQDHAALPTLYRAHDAFVLTSRHEAQCMAGTRSGGLRAALDRPPGSARWPTWPRPFPRTAGFRPARRRHGPGAGYPGRHLPNRASNAAPRPAPPSNGTTPWKERLTACWTSMRAPGAAPPAHAQAGWVAGHP